MSLIDVSILSNFLIIFSALNFKKPLTFAVHSFYHRNRSFQRKDMYIITSLYSLLKVENVTLNYYMQDYDFYTTVKNTEKNG